MSSDGRPELRIGDREREAAVASLGEHYASGRLTKEEYDERAALAFSARTFSALRPLFVDLPGAHPFAATTRAGAFSAPPRSGQTGVFARPAGAAGTGRRPEFRLPFVPLLLLLVGLAILLGAPWLVFIGLGALWLARSHRRGSGCGSGSRAPGWR